MITVAAPGRIALLIAEMMCQLGAKRTLKQRFLQLLEQAILADKVLRLFVAGQQFVQMFGFDRHRESSSSGYPRIAHTQYI